MVDTPNEESRAGARWDGQMPTGYRCNNSNSDLIGTHRSWPNMGTQSDARHTFCGGWADSLPGPPSEKSCLTCVHCSIHVLEDDRAMPIANSITLEEVIDRLNGALELDPSAMKRLVEARVPCNQGLADHPTIQVQSIREDGQTVFRVGVLGLLNGLFGVDSENWGAIEVQFDEDGEVLGFRDNGRR